MRFVSWIAASFAAALCISIAHAQAWKPSRNVEIIVGSGPGGGADITGRLMQKLLSDKKLVEVPVNVVNKTGGGSALSYVYLNQHPGDGHYLALSLQPMITAPLMLPGQISYTDMTPVAQLLNEYVAFGVRPDAPIRSGRDVIERLRKDPNSLSIVVSTALGGSNHLATVLALKAAGVDIRKLRVIVVKGAAEGITGVIGGHYDLAASSAAGMLPHLQSGKLRGIAVSGPRRLGDVYAQVPTWREQGVDAVYANWRGVVGPKGMTSAQLAYWDGVLGQLTQMPEWRDQLTKLLQEPAYLNSQDTQRYLQAQHNELKAVLVDVGLVK
ncbi:MAG TPA: tripartite tricarboxylate transporter substrate binding protein [Burkholderiales bacterium]|nr:tripartite tricarboxylate transporter substrate binding protein [Burkholderiales bacterium]